jgi:three-Cys-motif partner protein
MVEHVFGGDWTEDKLSRLREYLTAYRNIFASNERASFLKTWYVDAFAGTGSRSKPQSDSLPLDYGDGHADADDTGRFLDGSAKIALGLQSPFDHYFFIEESRKRAETLQESVRDDFSTLSDRVQFEIADANAALSRWCKERNWSKERAVVFLDPYGMQVEWNTIVTLASTKGIDLWYLFPFSTRVLTKDRNMDESWAKRLDILFGTPDWRSRFYSTREQETLFGVVENVERDATERNIQAFIEERLKSCFVEVARSLIVRNSRSSPLFALCFAASNEKGAKTAVKIAQHILQG